ncbi:chemotaxis protein CheX [Oryzomonas rubra]|uniref:Chemotaxis protein CheX n=1 Tax=Oryzomonas rubra TaxID=2509454 RepID=A0A5A9XK84_9BACT|nr:chemotaxis protein CheX [Oryzomonas rubra]KAA0893314.1 chemotaxis protein CheX [Oryzomonas rubra]
MAVKFFGQFLVEKGIVSREALLRAIELQEQKNLKFGEMALAMGYVTPNDIERAHHAQLSRDIKLGDLLVEIGILTLTQLNEVITRQKNNHLYIGEALVLVGAFSNEQLQQHLNEFKADQAPYISERVELPAGIPNPEVWEMAADLTYKMITRILGLPFRAGKCQTVTTVDTNFVMAAMDLSGDQDARFIISVSQGLQKSVAKAILRETSVDNEPQEVLEDTVMEFVNVVCGNIAAKASQAGRIVNINPPVTIRPDAEGLAVPAGHTGLCFPILVGDGETMQLVLLIKN